MIIPTVTSILAAIRYYEAQGGSASIYVNEDGMQAVPPELAEARRTFYELNNIGYCSRYVVEIHSIHNNSVINTY